MKNRISSRSFSLWLLALLFPALVPAVAFSQGSLLGSASPSVPALTAAQEAWLAGDLRTMAVQLREALEQNPSDVTLKQNVLSLLERAYETAPNGNLPVDWHLPAEIHSMYVGVKYHDSGTYTFRVYGATVHPESIAELQVVQYPDRVVLDKNAKIGSWGTHTGIDTMRLSFELQSDPSRQGVSSGLYLLNLTLTDGTRTQGWFILDDDVNSTAAPALEVPAANQVFATGNPVLSWPDFVSPERKSFDRRTTWVGISTNEPPGYGWNEIFGYYDPASQARQLTVGPGGSPGSVAALPPGSYKMGLDFHERRGFGDLDITRDSVTFRSFQVTK